MTTGFGRTGGTFEDWVQRVEDRLARLEGRSRVAVGNWVLQQQGDAAVLVYQPTGEVHVLAEPNPVENPGDEIEG